MATRCTVHWNTECNIKKSQNVRWWIPWLAQLYNTGHSALLQIYYQLGEVEPESKQKLQNFKHRTVDKPRANLKTKSKKGSNCR